MTDPTLLYRGELNPERREAVLAAMPGWKVVQRNVQDDISDVLPRVQIVAGALSDHELAQADRLEWVHSFAAGPDSQLTATFRAHPTVLTCSKGNGAIPLAEHAIMLMLMLDRNAARWATAHENREWDRFIHGELAGKTVGLLGLGHAGRDLAAKARAFHMTTIGLRRSTADAPEVDRLYSHAELHDFLAASDFVVFTAPYTPETAGLIGESGFRAMKPTAFFISISRGGIAEDAALLRAVDEGWIAGAGLDAHATEPLPPDSPFWTLRNTIITPHNGATTQATLQRGFDIFLGNLHRYRDGSPLMNVVDETAGY